MLSLKVACGIFAALTKNVFTEFNIFEEEIMTASPRWMDLYDTIVNRTAASPLIFCLSIIAVEQLVVDEPIV